MRRILLLLAFASFIAPVHAQDGSGVATALSNPVNSNGGVPTLNGSATPGDCLVWSANGIQDLGTTCVPSPIGAANLTGTGATAAATLANRATDFGVTFNLKTDFGAKCDGSTDDTTGNPELAEQGGSERASCRPGWNRALSPRR